MKGEGFCYAHHPGLGEVRVENGRRGGKRGGRGRGSGSELGDIKDQLRELAALLRSGEIQRGDATACAQVLNTYLRALDLEHRQRFDTENLVTQEQMNNDVKMVLDVITRHVRDAEARRAISQELRALSEANERRNA